LSYVSSGPFQWAIAEGLALPDTYWENFRHEMQAKRDFFTEGVRALGFGIIESEGTYFLSTDVRPLGFANGAEFTAMLPERAGVVAIPHSSLCQHAEAGAPYVRWAYCKKQEVLAEALERLARLN
jgi:N-succinyldiaminopimelate aminotransferase